MFQRQSRPARRAGNRERRCGDCLRKARRFPIRWKRWGRCAPRNPPRSPAKRWAISSRFARKEGDRVQSGQILAVIDDSQPRAAVEQSAAAVTAAQKEVSSAESELALAQSTLKRYQQLFDKKSISPQEFDEIKTRSQAAESRRDMARASEAQAAAALTQARTSLANTQIRAPFAGVVTEKKADAGTFASPGMPLFTVEDTRSYRLEAMVDESDIRLVRVGEAVPVLLDSAQSAEFRGRVAQIVPAADPASRSFLVKIELPADARVPVRPIRKGALFHEARAPRS